MLWLFSFPIFSFPLFFFLTPSVEYRLLFFFFFFPLFDFSPFRSSKPSLGENQHPQQHQLLLLTSDDQTPIEKKKKAKRENERFSFPFFRA